MLNGLLGDKIDACMSCFYSTSLRTYARFKFKRAPRPGLYYNWWSIILSTARAPTYVRAGGRVSPWSSWISIHMVQNLPIKQTGHYACSLSVRKTMTIRLAALGDCTANAAGLAYRKRLQRSIVFATLRGESERRTSFTGCMRLVL
jgi:hypothetical protein